MRKLLFHEEAKDDYDYWVKTNNKSIIFEIVFGKLQYLSFTISFYYLASNSFIVFTNISIFCTSS
jgi:hypothetical protein